MTAPAQTSPTKSKGKILLVEDDPLVVKMYSTKLESLGFETLIAQDGEQAVELAKKEKPIFILLDIMLPKLSGLDALKAIRALPSAKNTPVIVLSNLCEEKEKKQAEKLGVKEYLVKADLTPSQVVERIQKYLKQ